GIILALGFQNYAIVGPLTLLVLPLNMILSGIMFKLSRDSFREVGLRVRRNRKGFLSYLLLYQLFMSPVSVVGYMQELFRTKRNWKGCESALLSSATLALNWLSEWEACPVAQGSGVVIYGPTKIAKVLRRGLLPRRKGQWSPACQAEPSWSRAPER